MSEDSPTKRLSQIFESLSCLSDFQQQLQKSDNIKQQQKQQQQHQQQKYGTSSSTASSHSHHSNQKQSLSGSSTSTSLSSSSNQKLNVIPPPIPSHVGGGSSLGSLSCGGGGGGGSSGSGSASIGYYLDNPSSRLMMGSRSTPNSPRLLPKRSRMPPVLAPRPNAALIANPALIALDNDAPWPPFSSSSDHLDVHQTNNYHQSLPPEVNFISFSYAFNYFILFFFIMFR